MNFSSDKLYQKQTKLIIMKHELKEDIPCKLL